MRAGFVQNDPVFGAVKANCDRVAALLAGQAADLIVLPELFATGYQFTRRDEARELAEPVPGGPTTQFLLELAQKQNAVIVAGLAEIEQESVYNAAVVVGPRGVIGNYRKIHLFYKEKEVFDPGNLPLPVFDLGAVRVGVMICFDWRYPEAARSLALQGADVIAHPSNLVLPNCPDAMITRCLENRVYAVTADRVGSETRSGGETLRFIGQSQIVDPDGRVLYRASGDREETHIVDIDITRARDKSINPRNDLFADRRTGLYP